MTHSPAKILTQYLVDQGLASFPETVPAQPWPCYVGEFPEGDNEILVASNTGGRSQGRLMQGNTIENPSVQFLARSRTEDPGWAKLDAIGKKFDETFRAAVVVGAINYRLDCVSRLGPIVPLSVERNVSSGAGTQKTERTVRERERGMAELHSLNVMCTITEL